jgi:hypothetical protein
MLSILGGVVVLAITVGCFIALMPRDGKMHRWVGTEWEPYIGVGLCAGTALGLTMSLSGILNQLG